MKKILSSLLMLSPSLAFAAEHASGGEGMLGSTMLFKALNFLMLLIALHYFAKKPLAKMMRDASIAKKEEFDEKKKAVQEAEERLRAFKKQMAEEESLLAERNKAAQAAIEAEKNKIIAEAKAHAAMIEKNATMLMEQNLNKAKAEIRQFLAEEACKLAELQIKESVGAKEQKGLMKTYIERLDG
ncbi:MAG: hypothetical protein A2508_06735 [Candidatus Lambdaproteobacteria bacterium RIFOXYD12_FULL_49_8]|uniref:ATP synthase subunit b n=1 Tax=Candidatus Lambdaproteobacteria bacterium RIFOXYD2_FULL_50_16 TaxID=1817772 RepID=A0A1F6GED9_9PROT|nr:MAG: hypothetical protein A2527_01870 [Candidatus Lambdaproteobacteria bacterium RIFOXYD2_FULL_50_16]OGG98232.1 MAG: hypothetical protein A2508_06735 [Candidatus Lambdaproteobacteria bacterium RIFOXYD12_FULL_49_8]